jgi:hypothetical protein
MDIKDIKLGQIIHSWEHPLRGDAIRIELVAYDYVVGRIIQSVGGMGMVGSPVLLDASETEYAIDGQESDDV